MKVNTLNIQLKTSQSDQLKEKLKSTSNDDESFSKILVPIDFYKGGGKLQLYVLTFIYYRENEKGVLLKCNTLINKPILVAAFLGLICPISALLSKSYLLYFSIALIIFIIVFAFIFNRTIWTTKDYIIELYR